MNTLISDMFADSIAVKQRTLEECTGQMEQISQIVIDALKSGKKLLIFGNGGSASDAQHAAGEFVGRFLKERRALPAIALTADSAVATCISNDYCFEDVFARQVQALAQPGDVVIGISTSGNSKNVLRGLAAGAEAGAVTVGMTGGRGGAMKDTCDACLTVPSTVTARIQETHILVWHVVCTMVDDAFTEVTELSAAAV